MQIVSQKLTVSTTDYQPRQLLLFDVSAFETEQTDVQLWPVSLSRWEMRKLSQIAWKLNCKNVSELLSKVARCEFVVEEG